MTPLLRFPALRRLSRLSTVLLLAPLASTLAFEVDSTSDGSYGALAVTEDTVLALPPDGILHCTTVTVAEGATLRFARNQANTPVYLLATGDIDIAGTIHLDGGDGAAITGGEGGPGGWGGGNRADAGLPAGEGKGPGGGRNVAGYASGQPGSHAGRDTSAGPGAGSRYGSGLLVPLLGGSGGSGGANTGSNYGGGGGGGGAILLASDTRIVVTGSLLARGGNGGASSSGWWTNGGSGGAIRLLAPEVALQGTVSVSGGSNYGGAGYIRVDAGNTTQGPDSSLVGAFSRGRNRTVFPQNPPVLRLTHVAGNDIPLDQTDEVYLNLPPSGQATQPVTVRAEGFHSNVNVSIVLIPETGDRVIVNGTIDNRVQNPATRTFNVDFPLDTLVNVHVWTQQMTKDP